MYHFCHNISFIKGTNISPNRAVEIEAKAIKAGVSFARDVGIREAVFEGNSLINCKALQGDGGVPSSIQNVLEGTLELTTDLRSFFFFFFLM